MLTARLVEASGPEVSPFGRDGQALPLYLRRARGEEMKSRKANRTANAKAVVAVVIGLFLLAKVQVHASVAGASFNCSVLALIAGTVGLLILLAVAVIVRTVLREVRPGIYRPRHAS